MDNLAVTDLEHNTHDSAGNKYGELQPSQPSGTYTCPLHCHNCGDVAEYTLDKGTRVTSVECENCGVKAMKRYYYTARIIDPLEEDDDEKEM